MVCTITGHSATMCLIISRNFWQWSEITILRIWCPSELVQSAWSYLCCSYQSYHYRLKMGCSHFATIQKSKRFFKHTLTMQRFILPMFNTLSTKVDFVTEDGHVICDIKYSLTFCKYLLFTLSSLSQQSTLHYSEIDNRPLPSCLQGT